MRAMICSKCGYDLRGLPLRGGCPECGNTYDKDNFNGIAKPDNIYKRSENVGFWLKITAIVTSAFMIMGCSGLLSMFAVSPQKPLIAGGVVSCLILMMAIAMIVLKKIEDNEQ